MPDGAMVRAGEESFLIVRGQPLHWSFAGYHKVEAPIGETMLITPPSTLLTLVAGYDAGPAPEREIGGKIRFNGVGVYETHQRP